MSAWLECRSFVAIYNPLLAGPTSRVQCPVKRGAVHVQKRDNVLTALPLINQLPGVGLLLRRQCRFAPEFHPSARLITSPRPISLSFKNPGSLTGLDSDLDLSVVFMALILIDIESSAFGTPSRHQAVGGLR